MGLSFAEIIQALTAGFVSFVSPCVLPLIPAYISYITGDTLSDLKENRVSFSKLLINSIAFVVGFSLVFILLGASATVVGKFLSRNKKIFELVAGIIIIIFGLHTAQIVRFNFLSYEKKVKVETKNPGILKAFLLGFAFSFGWTPCVGPILGTILIQASTHETVLQGIILLTFYSLGLGVPFILTALAINKFFEAFKAIRKYFGQIEMFAGLLIIGVGIALALNLGLHSDYIVSILIASTGFAVLSINKVSISTIFGLILIFASNFLILNPKITIEGALNKSFIAIVIFLITGIISLYKVGNKNEWT